MRELINDPFYDRIKAYEGCVIDYCIMEDDTPYQGYRSHKDAVLFAMCKVIERCIDYQLKAEVELSGGRSEAVDAEPFPWSLDLGKAKGERTDAASFLCAPHGQDGRISYRYAFLNPPHGSGCGPDDFDRVNGVLFPCGAETLEVYEWSTDWSNYFDAGHEWWGAACWSVYDTRLNRFVVIMASATD